MLKFQKINLENFFSNPPVKPVRNHRILAIDVPQSLQTKEYITGVFYPYGDITVQLLKPGKNFPAEVKPWIQKIPDLGRTCCAVIEFETARAAKFAVHVLRQREHVIGFRLGLLKPGIEEILYEKRLPDNLGSSTESLLDSAISWSNPESDRNSESGAGITAEEVNQRMLLLVKQMLD